MRDGVSVVFQYVKSYLNSGFKLSYFFVISLMMAFLIYCNYSGVLSNMQQSAGLKNFLFDYLLFFLPFSIAWIFQKIFIPKAPYLSNSWLIILILVCPLFFAIRVNLNLHDPILREWLPLHEFKFWSRITGWLIRASVLMTMIYLLWFLKDRHSGPLYGTRVPMGSYRPYFMMLGFAIPLVVIAATQPSFLGTYPRAGMIESLDLQGKTWRYILFECSYAFDFLSIELFFRGLLIIGFMRIAGMSCIIPAAVFYCCIHFGKPMGEAISSYFGGILLGIISYHTKSIRGGLIVHIGLAFLMEIAGFLSKAFFY